MSSIYKDKKSPFYQTDIWVDGRKFSRSTKCKNQRDAKLAAERIEQELKEQLAGQGRGLASLQLDHIAGLWMRDIGDHHRGEGPRIDTYKIDRLIDFFGPDRSLADIGHDDVLKLILAPQAHRRQGEAPPHRLARRQ
jgi:hypothetical protein